MYYGIVIYIYIQVFQTVIIILMSVFSWFFVARVTRKISLVLFVGGWVLVSTNIINIADTI